MISIIKTNLSGHQLRFNAHPHQAGSQKPFTIQDASLAAVGIKFIALTLILFKWFLMHSVSVYSTGSTHKFNTLTSSTVATQTIRSRVAKRHTL